MAKLVVELGPQRKGTLSPLHEPGPAYSVPAGRIHMFSSRTSWDRAPNPLAMALREASSAGRPIHDLTESNPTRCELVDLAPAIRALGDPRGALYQPAPLGHDVARRAVASYYAAKAISVEPGRVMLSASTSESYAWLFGLLADPGDAVLVPRPSYPLLSFIAASQNVALVPYRLAREAGFRVDFADLRQQIGPRTRAIVVVHPNNPTGNFVRQDEAEQLVELAARHDLALVVDEVFADHVLGPLPLGAVPSFAGTRGALTFVMSGLSKVALLPQCKLGWTVVTGPQALVAEALARLELVADTFLSVATPVQLALADLLASRGAAAAAVRSRSLHNLAALDLTLSELGPSSPLRRLPVEGGWYAILEVPSIHDEDTWTEILVQEDGIVVHPGYFFDFDRDGFLVVSLLPPAAAFREAIRLLVQRIAGECTR